MLSPDTATREHYNYRIDLLSFYKGRSDDLGDVSVNLFEKKVIICFFFAARGHNNADASAMFENTLTREKISESPSENKILYLRVNNHG